MGLHLNSKGKPPLGSKQEGDVLRSALCKDGSGVLLEDANGGMEAGEQRGGWCRREDER